MAFTDKEYIVLRKVNTIPGWEPLQGFHTYREADKWCKGGDGILQIWTKQEYKDWYAARVAPFYAR